LNERTVPLVRIAVEEFEVTVLSFKISSVYPVSSFSGTKSIVLVSGLNWYGTSDTTLAKAFVITGGISLLTSILVLIKEKTCPRRSLVRLPD